MDKGQGTRDKRPNSYAPLTEILDIAHCLNIRSIYPETRDSVKVSVMSMNMYHRQNYLKVKNDNFKKDSVE
jgi:hypothetical protein